MKPDLRFRISFRKTCPLRNKKPIRRWVLAFILVYNNQLNSLIYGEFASFDKDLMDRIKDFENLDKNTKAKIFDVMDAYIWDAKARTAYAK